MLGGAQELALLVNHSRIYNNGVLSACTCVHKCPFKLTVYIHSK